MEEVADKVMRSYGMMVNLTATEEQSARERLTAFLKTQPLNSLVHPVSRNG